MSSVLGKFTLTSCTPLRVTQYKRDEQGRIQWNEPEKVEVGASVRLVPVQGEPFGQATPSGEITMAIHNSAAARVFLDRFAAHMADKDPAAKAPEFYVRLTPADEVERGVEGA